jgi:hypothetical protein
MGKVSRNIFSLVMALVMLITSNGIVLASHTCLKKSSTKVSLFESKGCCKQSKKSCESMQAKSFKSRCCVSSISYHKVNVNAEPTQKQVVDIPLFALPALALITTQVINPFVSSLSVKPPLLFQGGTELLKQLSSFRI